MRTEEERLAGLQQQLAEVVHRENALVAEELKSKTGLVKSLSIPGGELHAMTAYHQRVQREKESLREQRAKAEALVAEQRKRLLKARKDYRVLEKLKEKRKRAWTYLNDREIEDTAADNYISNWVRSESDR